MYDLNWLTSFRKVSIMRSQKIITADKNAMWVFSTQKFRTFEFAVLHGFRRNKS